MYDEYNHESKKNENRADMVNCLAKYYEKMCDAEEKVEEGRIGFQKLVDMYEREIEKLEEKLATKFDSKIDESNDEDDDSFTNDSPKKKKGKSVPSSVTKAIELELSSSSSCNTSNSM